MKSKLKWNNAKCVCQHPQGGHVNSQGECLCSVGGGKTCKCRKFIPIEKFEEMKTAEPPEIETCNTCDGKGYIINQQLKMF